MSADALINVANQLKFLNFKRGVHFIVKGFVRTNRVAEIDWTPMKGKITFIVYLGIFEGMFIKNERY